MPAHQHCALFYPPVESNTGTVSWVLRGSSGVHHPLNAVIRSGPRHPRKNIVKLGRNAKRYSAHEQDLPPHVK